MPFYIAKSSGEALTAREILKRGYERVLIELHDQPEARAEVMNIIGNVYATLGMYTQAAELLGPTADLRRELLGDHHPNVGESCHNLGSLYHERGDFIQAERYYREALAIRRQHVDTQPLLFAATMQSLGWMLAQADQLEEAEQLSRCAVEHAHVGTSAGSWGCDHIVDSIVGHIAGGHAYAATETSVIREKVEFQRSSRAEDLDPGRASGIDSHCKQVRVDLPWVQVDG